MPLAKTAPSSMSCPASIPRVARSSVSNIQEREHWDEYMKAYEKCISATSTDCAPWYIIPADDKPTARLLISRTIVNTMKELKMSFPKPTKAHRQELETIRKLLEKG